MPLEGMSLMSSGWILIIPAMLIALWAQFKLRSNYAHFSKVGTVRGYTGAQTAREILDRNGMPNVEIYEVEGTLSDHYDPSKRAVFLSREIFHGNSVASVSVAAHEVGHALQHKAAYGPLGLRMALVPVTGIATNMAMFLILGGIFLSGVLGPISNTLLWIGVGCYALLAFFQLVTLPVEYDASARAKEQLLRLGIVDPRESSGVSRMLGAAALTYVAAMISAVLELIRLILLARSREH
ncbi:MAG TPA: zinc metallopeptidase [Verrucomicrobiota bacterium]|nr:zinc metallopeptidase [Verrucomicrobiota bacterium]